MVLRKCVDYRIKDLHWKVRKVMRQKSRSESKYDMFSHGYHKHWEIALIRLGNIYILYKKTRQFRRDMRILDYEHRFAERHDNPVLENQLTLSEVGYNQTRKELIRELEMKK
jgi:hypothetical protein